MSVETHEDYEKLLQVVSGYETQLWLKHPENPNLIGEESLILKVNRAEKIFGLKFSEGVLDDKWLMEMSREFDRLNFRLNYINLDSVAKQSVIIVPSKRNFLYIGEEDLIGCLSELISYDNIRNVNILGNAALILTQSLEKAKSDCENQLEFRLLMILLFVMLNFDRDVQTISFISQFIINQHKIINLK